MIHLTSHSRMSGSRWVTTLSGLSGSLKTFFYSSSVYSCHFLISSASVRSLPFLCFIVPIFASNIPLISPIFLKKSLFLSFYCFPIILFIICLRKLSHLPLLYSGTPHPVGYVFPFLLCLRLLFFYKPPQTTTLSSCIFFFFSPWGWFWSLPPVQCYELLSIVLQAFSQIWSLKSIHHLNCIIIRDLGHIWMV